MATTSSSTRDARSTISSASRLATTCMLVHRSCSRPARIIWTARLFGLGPSSWRLLSYRLAAGSGQEPCSCPASKSVRAVSSRRAQLSQKIALRMVCTRVFQPEGFGNYRSRDASRLDAGYAVSRQLSMPTPGTTGHLARSDAAGPRGSSNRYRLGTFDPGTERRRAEPRRYPTTSEQQFRGSGWPGVGKPTSAGPDCTSILTIVPGGGSGRTGEGLSVRQGFTRPEGCCPWDTLRARSLTHRGRIHPRRSRRRSVMCRWRGSLGARPPTGLATPRIGRLASRRILAMPTGSSPTVCAERV